MEVKDILVIGSGGREHALIRKLKESPWTGKLYCAPGNGGIAADAQCVPIRATDIEGMTAFAKVPAATPAKSFQRSLKTALAGVARRLTG